MELCTKADIFSIGIYVVEPKHKERYLSVIILLTGQYRKKFPGGTWHKLPFKEHAGTGPAQVRSLAYSSFTLIRTPEKPEPDIPPPFTNIVTVSPMYFVILEAKLFVWLMLLQIVFSLLLFTEDVSGTDSFFDCKRVFDLLLLIKNIWSLLFVKREITNIS